MKMEAASPYRHFYFENHYESAIIEYSEYEVSFTIYVYGQHNCTYIFGISFLSWEQG